MAVNTLWVDRYKPKTLADLVLQNESVRKIFAKYIEEKSIPNLLLVGPAGTGKSSMSNVLKRELEIDRLDTLRINCSDEGIEAIRDKVKSFATTLPYGDFKLVQLEEIDGLGHQAQKMLRSFMEDVTHTCRFIATANNKNLLLPAIQSRFQTFEFQAPGRDFVMLRGAEIMEKEEIAFDLDTIERLAAITYPDVRQFIQQLEKNSTSGALKIVAAEASAQDWKLSLLDLMGTSNWAAARKLVCENSSKEELVDVYRFLYQNIHRTDVSQAKRDLAVVVIAKYQYQHPFCADGELNLAACFIELGIL
jgi:DNA polymerase III delta prime subunit